MYYLDVTVHGTVGNYNYTFHFPDNINPAFHRDAAFFTNILNTYLYERTLNGYQHDTSNTGTLPESI